MVMLRFCQCDFISLLRCEEVELTQSDSNDHTKNAVMMMKMKNDVVGPEKLHAACTEQ